MNSQRSLLARIFQAARTYYPDKPAAIDSETRLTYRALGSEADKLTARLTGAGLVPGDRVAILDNNSVNYLRAHYACAQAGLIMVPLNTRLANAEIRDILNDVEARALAVTTGFEQVYEEIKGDLMTVQHVAVLGSGRRDDRIFRCTGKTEARELTDAEGGSSDLPTERTVLIYYTSGTTGKPRGVCLTESNIVSCAIDGYLQLDLNRNDVWLHSAPLFHLVDAWAVWGIPLLGGTQVAARFQPERFLEIVAQEKVSAVALAPTMMDMVARSPEMERANLESLRLIYYGGAPTPPSVLRRVRAAFKCDLDHGYGISEASGPLSLRRHGERCADAPDDDTALHHHSAGRPTVHVSLKVVDDAGRTLGPGELGELLVAGPRVMKGYWRKPEETSAVLRDGWYHSGDLGYLDQGEYVHVIDRKKDMIITGGENVYSTEVEAVVSLHPAVLEAAVIGVPEEKWGELVKAVVVLKPGACLEPAELEEFCRSKIAGYKIPRVVEFAAELPRTVTGKISKRSLREAAVRKSAHQDSPH